MDTSDKKVIFVTFISHYGAMLLKNRMGQCCTVRAVPRFLSSSCGTCACVENSDLGEILKNADSELLEAVYLKEKGEYVKIYG